MLKSKSQMPTPTDCIQATASRLHGTPAFIVGSCVAAEQYRKNTFNDLDVFVPTQEILFVVIQKLLEEGYTLDGRFVRVWHRWQRYGTKGWHTNSMRLLSPELTETNIVFKMEGRHPLNSLSQVLESFDFGLLAMGYETEYGVFRDLRSYLFPDMNPNGPLPLTPKRRNDWLQGFISQYAGTRQATRVARYALNGYPMQLVIEDVSIGYRNAALYYSSSPKEGADMLNQIYLTLASLLEDEEFEKIQDASKELTASIGSIDALDEIMEALS